MPAECDVWNSAWLVLARRRRCVREITRRDHEFCYRSVGHGTSLLLNIPPDRRGLLTEDDVDSLQRFGQLLSSTFAKNLAAEARVTATSVRRPDDLFAAQNLVDGDPYTYWSTNDDVTTPYVVSRFERAMTFNVARLRENIRLGPRVEGFALDHWSQGVWNTLAEDTKRRSLPSDLNPGTADDHSATAADHPVSGLPGDGRIWVVPE
jgi:alpha-L-fucosidase